MFVKLFIRVVDVRNLDMTTLRSFLAVADQGGVTKAAGVLNLTQSAVSMQLKRLEELLDVALFDRSGRGIALTGEGEQLVSYARRILALNDEAVDRLTDDRFEGELALGVPHDIIYQTVPQVLKRFAAAYPRVKVNLLSSSTITLHERLVAGEVDLILTTETGLKPGGETLAQAPLCWAGALDGQAHKRRPMRLGLGKVCAFRPIAMAALDEAELSWEMAVESDDDRSIEVLVGADLAVTAMLEISLPPHLEPVPLTAGLPNLGVQQINMYQRAGQSALREDLAEMLRQGYGAERLAAE